MVTRPSTTTSSSSPRLGNYAIGSLREVPLILEPIFEFSGSGCAFDQLQFNARVPAPTFVDRAADLQLWKGLRDPLSPHVRIFSSAWLLSPSAPKWSAINMRPDLLAC
jgi:hypothetical protein